MKRTEKSLIETIGVYLPPKRVTTSEILDGCVNKLRFPLERLTGIKVRHRAGETEFSIDLAAKAVEDCLQRSHAAAADFDLLVCTNISRYDGPRRVSYEPATSVTLRRQFGFDRAVAMDLSNACAGMWTGIFVVDALIRTGAIRRGMVVSGEYISYLTETAQKEIVDYVDPQLASLTLGDAGVAVALESSPRPEVGFHDIDLYTLGKYSRFCIAKPTEQEHGGAAMYTDAIKVTAAIVPRAATHAEHVLRRNDQPLDGIDHIIPHQTSRLTMEGAVEEMKRRFHSDFSGQLINNLAQRGNTASTSHLLALRDSILSQRIRPGDNIVFSISGSGQTTGTALYTCDDLPNRLQANVCPRKNGRAVLADSRGETLRVPMCVESLATTAREPGAEPDTLALLTTAAQRCLAASAFDKEQIELLLSVGVYRKDFVTEPAIAALLAGDLAMNDDRAPDEEHRTLAFDLFNGPVGFLNACYLVSELARAGSVERAMIVASEVENNAAVAPERLLGLCEMASAVILHEADDGETGFSAFCFRYFPEYHDACTVYGTWNERGRPYLVQVQHPEIQRIYADCIARAVAGFLHDKGVRPEQIAVLLPPQISPAFVREIGRRLGFDRSRVIDVSREGADLATSSTPVAIEAVLAQNLVSPGDLGLIVNVGAGVQVGCALYRF